MSSCPAATVCGMPPRSPAVEILQREPMSNITWHEHQVTREDREKLAGHAGCVVWFTGLSGSGKSTVANAVDQQLHQLGIHTYLLDGDNVRHGLNASKEILARQFGAAYAERWGLGFSAEDRQENIRRVGAVSQLFCAAGLVTLTAFVSPFRQDREEARSQVTRFGRADDFLEVYVDTPLEVCESRDPKGLYKQARAGLIKDFTGIDSPYEAPHNPELRLEGGRESPQALAAKVIAHLRRLKKIP